MIRVRQARSRSSLARQGLARDTLIILGGALAAILLTRLVGTQGTAVATASPTPPSSAEVVTVGSQVVLTLPPIVTLGPIVNPSAGLDATPTPVPFETLGPPTPTPPVEPSPGATVKPTPKPTAKPVPTPTQTPITVAGFSCVASAGYVLTCTDKSTNPTTWSWNWGDGSPPDTTKNAVHTYAVGTLTATVTLSITGPGGSSSDSQFFTLVP